MSSVRFGECLRRKLSLFVLALPFCFLMPAQAFAQGQSLGAVAPQHQSRHPYQRPRIDDRVKSLAKTLDLNETQQAEVKKVLENRQGLFLKMLGDQSLSSVDRINAFRAINDHTVERIGAVLNEEQKKKYDPLVQRETPRTSPQPSVDDWLDAMNRSK